MTQPPVSAGARVPRWRRHLPYCDTCGGLVWAALGHCTACASASKPPASGESIVTQPPASGQRCARCGKPLGVEDTVHQVGDGPVHCFACGIAPPASGSESDQSRQDL